MPADNVSTVVVDAMGGDNAPDAVLDGVTARSAATRTCDRSRGRRRRGAALLERSRAMHRSGHHRSHRHGRASRHRRPIQEGLVDRRRLPRRTRGSGRRLLLGRLHRGSMAAATLVMGRIAGVKRPAIATVLPTAGPPIVLLDVGANADCKPEYLVQFAHMGAAYAPRCLGVDRPARRAAQHRRRADEGLAPRAGGPRADGRATCPASSATSRDATSSRAAST